MYFKKISMRFLTLSLCCLFTFALLSVFGLTKVIAAKSVEYPFAKEDYALANAPTITGQESPSTGDLWQWYEQIFDKAVDLTSAKYLAVEYKNVTGNPGLTLGVMSQGQRFGTYVDGQPIYFVKEDGTVSTLSVLYSSVNLGTDSGMILIPLSSLSLVGWGQAGSTLASATSFFFETNAKYNSGFSMKIGEVGYIKGDPFDADPMTKVLDLSKEIKTSKMYASQVTVDFPSKATDTTKPKVDFEYPFTTGLSNAPKFIGKTSQTSGDVWQYMEVIFDKNADLTLHQSIAFEYEPVAGNPGLTLGVVSQGMRFGTYTDGLPVYFVKDDGTVTSLSVLYGAVTLGNEKGMVVIPLSTLSLVGWASNQEATLASVSSVFIETNAKYNWGFAFKVGDVGAYKEDYLTGSKLEKLLDLTTGIKKNKATGVEVELEFPASSQVDSIVGMKANYPFQIGENAFNNTIAWVGPASGDSSDNWQTLRAQFDVTNLLDASYIAIHYNAKAGAPGITFGIESGNARYSVVGSDGEEICIMNENGDISRACYVTYDAITLSANTTGCLLIPVKLLKLQFGTDTNTLATSKNLVLTTNSRYNFLFETLIGEIGFYTGQPCDEDFTYNRLSGLNYGTPEYHYSVTSDNQSNKCSMYVHTTERTEYGDTTIGFTATGKVNGSLIPWIGGAAGTQTMTKDSYGDPALSLVSDGPRPGADAYTAFTIFDGKHLDWSSAKGVTLWARNDSNTEVSFNLEIDVLSSHTQARGRFNITQGNRFWLYDVNTGKQTIYMTRPCVTLPVGFEGWVRIPFDAFDQAQWSLTDSNYGVFERKYFMTEGSYVPYMGITIYSGNYTGCSFAVNKIGAYNTTPSFISALVPQTPERKNILELMGLDK